MARQIAILVTCDGCGTDGLDPDRPLILALGQDKPRQLDLCSDCQVKLWGPLAKIYADAATVAPAKAPAPKAAKTPMDCPECDYTGPSRSALRTHLESTHGVALGAWQYAHGRAVDSPDVPVPFKCEDCRMAFVNLQGMAQHNRANHPGREAQRVAS